MAFVHCFRVSLSSPHVLVLYAPIAFIKLRSVYEHFIGSDEMKSLFVTLFFHLIFTGEYAYRYPVGSVPYKEGQERHLTALRKFYHYTLCNGPQKQPVPRTRRVLYAWFPRLCRSRVPYPTDEWRLEVSGLMVSFFDLCEKEKDMVRDVFTYDVRGVRGWKMFRDMWDW